MSTQVPEETCCSRNQRSGPRLSRRLLSVAIVALMWLSGGALYGQKCRSHFEATTTDPNSYAVKFDNRSELDDYDRAAATWTFGDGQSSVEPHPHHYYSGPGQYEVCMTITDSANCTDTYCDTVVLEEAKPCMAYFSPMPDGQDPKKWSFNEASTAAQGEQVVEWNWDFGDGNFQTGPQAQHEFPHGGEFMVCLSIKTSDNCENFYCHQITVDAPDGGDGGNGNDACNADWSYEPSSVDPLEVNFTDRSSSGDGQLTTWSWSFDDGNNSADANPIHRFNQSGVYRVCLEIGDDKGCQNSWCMDVHVGEGNGGGDGSGKDCFADFWNQSDSLNPLKVSFYSASQGKTPPFVYSWEVDGQTYTTEEFEHAFSQEGDYEVCHVITDSDGCSDTACRYIYVGGSHGGGDEQCIAEYGYKPAQDDPMRIIFDDYSSAVAGVSTWSWEFGNGSTSSERAPEYLYTQEGEYQVCLTITTADGCTSTKCDVVHVGESGGNGGGSDGCHADFGYDLSETPKEVMFSDNSFAPNGISSWSWNFGDGSPEQTGSNPVHQYETFGWFEVCLTIQASDGCENTHCRGVEVQGNLDACFAKFFFDFDENDPNTVHFTSDSRSPNNIIEYNWGTGEDQWGQGQEFTKTFPGPGKYEVCHQIKDDKGCDTYMCQEIFISDGHGPDCFGSFTYALDPDNPLGAQFFYAGSSNITGGFWNFGDGDISDDKEPYHQFPGPGFYQVCLTVMDSTTGCQNEFCDGVKIEGEGGGSFCFADFDYVSNSDLTVNFSNISQGDISGAYWNFGDGVEMPSNELNLTHQYTAPGFYEVCLSVRDDSTGCQDHKCEFVEVRDSSGTGNACLAQFHYFPTGNQYEYEFANASQGNINTVLWNFGGGQTTRKWEPRFRFEGPGYYEVCLVVRDTVNECQDRYCEHVKVEDENSTTCFADFNFFIGEDGNVNFTDASVGEFTEWYWSFGDGGVSQEQHPTHQYNEQGYYDVCLNVFDSVSGCQANMCKDVKLIDDNGTFCNADFQFFPSEGGNVVFENTSQGSYTETYWEFGDGSFSHDAHPVHQYTESGFYHVCLSIFDPASDCKSEFCTGVNVMLDSNDVNCFAEFSFFLGQEGKVNFKDESVGNITDWRWDFGNGKFSKEQNPSHQYTEPGFYHVCLAILDSNSGCQQFVCHEVNLIPDDGNFCVAKFENFATPEGIVHFEERAQGNVTNYHWEFGDGNFSDEANPSHEYAEPGYYFVCLTVFDTVSGCQNHYCEDVVVQSQDGGAICKASFNSFPEADGSVNFDNTSIGELNKVHWDFGDGTFSNDWAPHHMYANGGLYRVKLRVGNDSTGCQDTYEDEVYIESADGTGAFCLAEFGFIPLANQEVQFNNTSKGDYNKKRWDFGDGKFGHGDNPVHRYEHPGFYPVCLTIFNEETGCQSTFCDNVEIFGDDGAAICFAHFDFFPEETNIVKFESAAQGNITNYKWEFGDGKFSREPHPRHEYSGPGFYDVCLTVFDSVSGCQSRHCMGVPVIDENSTFCESKFEYFPEDGNTVKFQSTAKGTFTHCYWEFGDGNNSDEHHAAHTFPHAGYFEVCLTVFDSVSGCMNTYCDHVSVGDDSTTVDCIAEFTSYVDDEGTVHFTNNSLGTVEEFHWDFGDGKFSADRDPMHKYDRPGTYHVCMNAFDPTTGCQAHFCDVVHIIDEENGGGFCQAEFKYFPQENNEVRFNSTSIGDFNKMRWDFGDGRFGNGPEPVHRYNEPGYYSVCLTVFNDETGCQSTFCEPVEILPSDGGALCHADFSFFPDANQVVNFENLSVGSFTNYRWEFGDGKFSKDEHPSHTYPAPGFYEVCLTVFDSASGCQARHCMGVPVIDENSTFCEAKFEYFPDEANGVSFINKSKGEFTHWHWELGDGNFSNDFDPVHTYPHGGYYHVCLTVFDSVSGCMNTYCDEVKLELDSNSVDCFAEFTSYVDDAGDVHFTNNSIGIDEGTEFHWDFGNGRFSKDENPVHRYQRGGVYHVCLNMFNPNTGCQAHFCHEVFVEGQEGEAICNVEFKSIPLQGTDVRFSPQVKGDYTKIRWDFGDGRFSNAVEPVHHYDHPGYFHVCVTTFDDATGCQAHYCDDVELIDDNTVACNAAFGFFPETDGSVVFEDHSMGNITNWRWDFGDGKFSKEQHPVHDYDAGGFYEVCLTVFDSVSGCQARHCMGVPVIDDEASSYCEAKFQYFPEDGSTVKFANESKGDFTHWRWEFGDGNFSEDYDAVHTFPHGGYFPVCLTVFDSASGCMHHFCDEVFIEHTDSNFVDCIAEFTYYPDDQGAVHFTNASLGEFTGFHWAFGDGGFSRDENPVHTFPRAGVYDVCLNAHNDETGCQAHYCMQVFVEGSEEEVICDADFKFMTLQGTDVRFKPEVKGAFTKVRWDFGNGRFSDMVEPVHHYDGSGIYNVCLTTFDDASGCQATACQTVEVLEDENTVICHAMFAFFPNEDGSVQFEDLSEGSFTNWKWDFGDGKFSRDQHPSHSYAEGGFYEVCLAVFDSVSGCQARHCMGVPVVNEEVTYCEAGFEFFAESGNTVQFKNTSKGEFTKWHWEMGDGSFSTDMDPVHTFEMGGYVPVCLTIFDEESGCMDHYCDEVFVEIDSSTVACAAEFSYYPEDDGTVHFTNASVGEYTNIRWEFGNGKFSNEDNPSHKYTRPGVYQVCVKIFNSQTGCKDHFCQVIYVTAEEEEVICDAEFKHFPLSNTEERFKMTARGEYTDILWDFGDGQWATDNKEPVHNYAEGGFYEVCLTVFNADNGCQATSCDEVEIVGDTNQVVCNAGFDFFPQTDGSVAFEDASEGEFTKWHWDFGDGKFSKDPNPTHEYARGGFYQVCLTVFDEVSGCQAHECRGVPVVEVDETFCEAKFEFFPVTETGVQFKNASQGDFTHTRWEFGDGRFSNESDPMHAYGKGGYFPVCLTVFDEATGCMDRKCEVVELTQDTTIVDCIAEFTFYPDEEGNVHFTNTSVGDFTKYRWRFGDGTFSSEEHPVHKYAPGFYEVTLTVFDEVSGCQAKFHKVVHVVYDDVAICEAKFDYFQGENGEVDFNDVSLGDFTNWFWEFGNGKTSRQQYPTTVFTETGTYDVCLTVFDSISGCKATYCEPVKIVIDEEEVYCDAKFGFFPTSDTEVAFENLSEGTFTSYFWKFSNGVRNYDFEPVHDFEEAGVHHACLTVRDSVSGCQSRYCEEIELIDTNTVYCSAQFTYYPEDKTVYFTPNAVGSYTGLFWDFGDGYNANEGEVSHTFAKGGYFDVCLTVRDSVSGCFDTWCETVNVVGEEEVDEACLAKFDYFVEPGTNTVIFTDASQGGANAWYWDFGNNTPAGITENPTITYEKPGYYEVCLTVFTANGCQESTCEIIEVGDVSDDCMARFTYFEDEVTSTAHMNNQSLGNIVSYEWDFGDDFVSVQEQPSHTYAETGYYAVCLTIEAASGCKDSKCEDVRVGNALENPCLFSCVWPGDANSDLEANHYDVLVVGLNYGETGPAREDATTDWYGQFAQDWSTWQWDGVNNKHGDCDGDGDIDDSDIAVIDSNFAFSHPYNPPKSNNAEDLSFQIVNQEIVVGEEVEIIINAGDKTDISLYGIGFEFALDPTLFDYSTMRVDFSNSWLGTSGDDMLTYARAEQSLGKILIAEVRNDQVEREGKGELARIFIKAIGIDEDGTEVELTTNGGLGAEGDTVEFASSGGDTLEVIGFEDIQQAVKALPVYPNPTSGDLHFNVPEDYNEGYDIYVYDNYGKLVYINEDSNGGNVRLNLSNVANGMYTIQVVGEKVHYRQRFSLLK